jgi:electron transfer flavoprotein beta subunit
MLGIPDVSAVTALALTGRTAEITRQMEEESEVLTAELPLLATVAPSLNHPRYPSIQGLQKKWTVKAQILTAADLQADPGRIGIQGSPTQVKRVRPVAPPKKENLVIQETKTADSVRVLMQALQKAQVF